MILCGRFQGALLLWMMAHLEVTIEVSVAGKHRYPRTSSYGKRRFVMVVEGVCREEQHHEDLSIQLLVFLRGKWNQLMSREENRYTKPSPACRRQLYTIQASEDSAQREILNREELYQIRNLTQRTVLWMIDTAIVAGGRSVGSVGFKTATAANVKRSSMTIGDILWRWPRTRQGKVRDHCYP